MNKTITIAAYSRPDNLRMLVDSLRGQLANLDDWTVYVRVDAGDALFEQVLDEAEKIDFVDCKIFWPEQNEGINDNTYWLMNHVFDTVKADYNLYLEDDLLLSPDTIGLANWYIEHENELLAVEGIDDIAGMCLCKFNVLFPGQEAGGVFFSRAFVGWGFLMGKRQWWAYGNPAWCSSEILWGRPGMWDSSVANYIRKRGARVYNLFPELSRITNTGREGVHFTPEKYDRRMAGHVYQQEQKTFAYYLTGVK